MDFFSNRNRDSAASGAGARRPSRDPGQPSRLSVRGAFGPSGALWQQRRRSSQALSRAQVFQLDRCLDAKSLDKIIYQMNTSAETRSQAKNASLVDSNKQLDYDIEGFATFLGQQRALNTLLFWKDTEEYTTLFGTEERSNAAEKIWQRYLEPGAEFEVTSIQGPKRDAIKKELSNPPEELFLELQQEAYGTLLFELFPRFWDAIKTQDKEGKAKRSKLTADTDLKSVLKANDLEIHLFAEYCREHLCEDAVIFLLETAMFALLFDPHDLYVQGKRIYDTYLDPTSEGRIVVSSSHHTAIKAVLDAAADSSKQQGSAVATGAAVTPKLFDKVVDEVTGTLTLDVWPRYKETVLSGEDIRLSSLINRKTVGPGGDTTSFIDMSKPSKRAVDAAIRDPEKLELMRAAAASQGVKETVDFCVDCQAYKLLFSEADRKPRAKLIHNTYLQAGCDTPVNLPDTMIKSVEKELNAEQYPPELYEECLQEVLQIMSDNIFSHYLKNVEKAEERAKEAAVAKAAAAKASGGGGCCLLM